MNEENITVRISGTAVYKAVKNCLKDSEALQTMVAQSLSIALANSKDFVHGAIVRKLDIMWAYDWRTEVIKVVQEEAGKKAREVFAQMGKAEIVKILVGR